MTSSASQGTAYLIERALQPAYPLSNCALDLLELISLSLPHPPYHPLILFALPSQLLACRSHLLHLMPQSLYLKL